MNRITIVFCTALLLVGAASRPAAADEYTKTKYPIVLCHGMAGFNQLFGVVDYFYGIEKALRDGGADVYVTSVSAFNSTEARGEQLLAQVEEILAVSGKQKVHLIGHSHGGLDARYVAAVRPDLIASVTSVGSPHAGAELADYLRANVKDGSFTEDVLGFFANSMGTLLSFLSGTSNPQDAISALESLSSIGQAQYNALYPQGLPSSSCGQGPSVVNGVRYFSWSGTRSLTNIFDVTDVALALTDFIYGEENDGLVGKCSSHLGSVIRDDYKQNHVDEVNQLFGIVHLFSSNPKSIYRAHANRLRNLGM